MRAVLWAWALNLWDLTLSPGRCQNWAKFVGHPVTVCWNWRIAWWCWEKHIRNSYSEYFSGLIFHFGFVLWRVGNLHDQDIQFKREDSAIFLFPSNTTNEFRLKQRKTKMDDMLREHLECPGQRMEGRWKTRKHFPSSMKRTMNCRGAWIGVAWS